MSLGHSDAGSDTENQAASNIPAKPTGPVKQAGLQQTLLQGVMLMMKSQLFLANNSHLLQPRGDDMNTAVKITSSVINTSLHLGVSTFLEFVLS